MRMSMAYFAGAGTVIAAIAAGLGGGLMISDIVSPHATRELSKMELRAKEQSSPPPVAAQSQQAQPPQQQAQSQSNDAQRKDQAAPMTASNAPQGPVPYLAQTEQAAAAPVVVTAAPQNPPQPQTEQKPPQPQNDTANAASRPAAAVTAGDQASKPDNAYAKAREADLKRPDEKRKAERHQQWTTRRQQREQDSRGADEQVRDDSEPREIIVRRDDSDRPSLDRPSLDRPMTLFPRLNLFGQD